MTINIFCALPPDLLGANGAEAGAVLGFLGCTLYVAVELLGLPFLGLTTGMLLVVVAETKFEPAEKTASVAANAISL